MSERFVLLAKIVAASAEAMTAASQALIELGPAQSAPQAPDAPAPSAPDSPPAKEPKKKRAKPAAEPVAGPCDGNWVTNTKCPHSNPEMHTSRSNNYKTGKLVPVCKACFRDIAKAKKAEKAAGGAIQRKRSSKKQKKDGEDGGGKADKEKEEAAPVQEEGGEEEEEEEEEFTRRDMEDEGEDVNYE
jgi:hypothetical protein